MSKITQLEDFFADVWEDKSKCINNLSIQNDDMKVKVEFFNNGSGFGYGNFDMYFNDTKIFIPDKLSDYSFLYFNTGDARVCMKHKKMNEKIFSPNDVWIGTVNEPIKGESLYQGKQRFKSQCVMIDNRITKDIEFFKRLEGEQDFCLAEAKTNWTQKIILQELENSYIYEGKMREIFIESKILEIVYKSLRIEHTCPDCNGLNLCEHDKKAIKKAREILLKNMSNPPSIKELARICAINEFKLKRGFKQLFNATIYKTLQKERLKNAKDLLASQDINVSEAARIVGCKNLSHFSKIFKEQFDVLPNELLKRRKHYVL